MQAASQLGLEWKAVLASGLDTDAILKDAHRYALDNISAGNAKESLNAIVDLQNCHKILNQVRATWKPVEDENLDTDRRMLGRNLVVSNYLRGGDIKGAFKALVELQNHIKAVKADMAALKELQPPGFQGNPDQRLNPAIPAPSRPKLTLAEANAVFTYAGPSYLEINKPLWSNAIPPPPHDETHKHLQEAFPESQAVSQARSGVSGIEVQESGGTRCISEAVQGHRGEEEIDPAARLYLNGNRGEWNECVCGQCSHEHHRQARPRRLPLRTFGRRREGVTAQSRHSGESPESPATEERHLASPLGTSPVRREKVNPQQVIKAKATRSERYRDGSK